MKKRLHSKQFGFSMLEALISTLIVAVALLGLAKISGVTLIASSDSRMKTQAQNLAQDKIEELRAFPHQQKYDDDYVNNKIDASKEAHTAPGSNAEFTRTWGFDPHSFPDDTDVYKQTSVEVDWTDQRGEKQKVKLISNIAKGDPIQSGVALLNMVDPSKSCIFNGKTYPDGYSLTAYKDTVADQCISEKRTCNASQFTGSYTYTTCSTGCKLPDGTYLMSGLQVNLCNPLGLAQQAFICLGDNLLPNIPIVSDLLKSAKIDNVINNLLGNLVVKLAVATYNNSCPTKTKK